MDFDELAAWTPFWLRPDGDRPLALWLPMQHEPLRQPFFQDSVADFRRRQPEKQSLLTPLDALAALAEETPGLAPRGLIFHMSRCGSTALSRALAASERHLVVSEADPINQLLAAETAREALLRPLVSVLGRKRGGAEESYFLKLTSWNILHLDLWRRLFPDTPWAFVFRDPVEVMVSVLEKPTGWMANPDGSLVGDASVNLVGLPRAETAARVLGHFCRLAAAGDGPRLLLDHRDFSRAAFERLLRHFGGGATESSLDSMVEASRYYSKSGSSARRYRDDSRAKVGRASAAVVDAAETWARPAYRRLRELASRS